MVSKKVEITDEKHKHFGAVGVVETLLGGADSDTLYAVLFEDGETTLCYGHEIKKVGELPWKTL